METFLAAHGFEQVLHLPPSLAQHGERSLPDQYHYRDRYNTDVIYLAGKDIAEEKERLPVHASRWWLYPSGNVPAYTTIKGLLALRWGLSWHPCADTNGGDS